MVAIYHIKGNKYTKRYYIKLFVFFRKNYMNLIEMMNFSGTGRWSVLSGRILSKILF